MTTETKIEILEPFGGLRVTQGRKQEINGGTSGIDGPIEVALAAFHSNVGFVDAPRLVGRLKMASQPCSSSGA